MDGTLDLRTLEDWTALAARAAGSGFFPVRRPEEALVILLTGRELGIAPMAALRGIYVVSGRPVLSADLIVAAVRRSGLCVSWRTVESTPERCTIETQRMGEEHAATKTWTKADAQRAGLLGKGTWTAYPAQMLRHRCAADLAREVYPDVVLGLYDPDEMPGREEPAAREEPRATPEPRVTEQAPDWLAHARETVAELGGTLTLEQAAATACAIEDRWPELATSADDREALDRALRAALPEGTSAAAYARACGVERCVLDLRRAQSLDEVDAIGAEAAKLRLPKAAPERARLATEARGARARLAPPPEPDGDGPRGGRPAPSHDPPADVAGSAAAPGATAEGAVMSAEAWAAHLTRHGTPHAVAGALRKRRDEFQRAGVWTQREAVAASRLAALPGCGDVDSLAYLRSCVGALDRDERARAERRAA